MTEHEHDSGCDCGCGETKTISIEFDDETVVECDIIGTFENNGKEYVALLTKDDSEEILIYGVKEDGDEIELIDITDEEEFQSAAAVLDELMSDE